MYRYGYRLTLTDSDAANYVSKYVDQFRPAAVTNPVSERPDTCWFYAESTVVPYHTVIICRTSIIQLYTARGDGGEDFFVEQYNDTAVFASKRTLRREHALGARGHGVGHLVMVPTYGGKALGSRKILKIYLHKYTVSCNFSYSALYEKNR